MFWKHAAFNYKYFLSMIFCMCRYEWILIIFESDLNGVLPSKNKNVCQIGFINDIRATYIFVDGHAKRHRHSNRYRNRSFYFIRNGPIDFKRKIECETSIYVWNTIDSLISIKKNMETITWHGHSIGHFFNHLIWNGLVYSYRKWFWYMKRHWAVHKDWKSHFFF